MYYISRNSSNLCVRLSAEAHQKLHFIQVGKDNRTEPRIGKTAVRMEAGNLYCNVTWGIDGTDYPVSPEVASLIDIFQIEARLSVNIRFGVYTLRRGKKIHAKARVYAESFDKDDEVRILVTSADREKAVALYELIRDGKLAPDTEVEEFKQIEGGVMKIRRLEARVAQLNAQLLDKNQLNARLVSQLDNARNRMNDLQKLMRP